MTFANSSKVTDHQQPECKGGQVDRVLRLGLLKLASGISGLTSDALTETFMLNLARLRGVQAEIQKIIISISILICRQISWSEHVVAPTDMETIISSCTEQLSELLGHIEDVGIKGIIEIISGFARVTDDEKVQTRKVMMARILAKSLQAGDAVCEKYGVLFF